MTLPPGGGGRLPGGSSLEAVDYPTLRSALLREVARAGRHGQPLSCLAVGLDGLERPRDRMAELRRNCLLAVAASALRDALRIYDTVARYGAGEFLVLLPGTRLTTAAALAERLRNTIRHSGTDLLAEPVEISVGVAEWDEPAVTGDELLDRADRALGAARSGGRKVVPFPELGPPGVGGGAAGRPERGFAGPAAGRPESS